MLANLFLIFYSMPDLRRDTQIVHSKLLYYIRVTSIRYPQIGPRMLCKENVLHFRFFESLDFKKRAGNAKNR